MLVCIMPCLCVVCLPCCVLLLDSSRFVAIVRMSSSMLGSSSWLHPFVFFMDSFFFLVGFQARWPYLRYHFYLCFASTRSISMLALPTTVYHASLLPCQTSNHHVLANRCLAMSPLLLSPSYSVVSCRWSCRLFHVGTWLCWDITIFLIFNSCIYILGKGWKAQPYV